MQLWDLRSLLSVCPVYLDRQIKYSTLQQKYFKATIDLLQMVSKWGKEAFVLGLFPRFAKQRL